MDPSPMDVEAEEPFVACTRSISRDKGKIVVGRTEAERKEDEANGTDCPWTQQLYSCLDCRSDKQFPLGICKSCRVTCHANCNIVYDLWTYPYFVCDCCTTRNANKCHLTREDVVDIGPARTNRYGPEFGNLFCFDQEDYNLDNSDMDQCAGCSKWYHINCIGVQFKRFVSRIDESDKYERSYICRECMKGNVGDVLIPYIAAYTLLSIASDSQVSNEHISKGGVNLVDTDDFDEDLPIVFIKKSEKVLRDKDDVSMQETSNKPVNLFETGDVQAGHENELMKVCERFESIIKKSLARVDKKLLRYTTDNYVNFIENIEFPTSDSYIGTDTPCYRTLLSNYIGSIEGQNSGNDESSSVNDKIIEFKELAKSGNLDLCIFGDFQDYLCKCKDCYIEFRNNGLDSLLDDGIYSQWHTLDEMYGDLNEIDHRSFVDGFDQIRSDIQFLSHENQIDFGRILNKGYVTLDSLLDDLERHLTSIDDEDVQSFVFSILSNPRLFFNQKLQERLENR